MIAIKNLYKAFGDHQVLNGVDLEINTGESLVILGRSGSGKSVLLKLIIGLIRTDRGSIQADGKEVTKLNYNQLSELRKKLGLLFPMAALFDRVPRNVTLSQAFEPTVLFSRTVGFESILLTTISRSPSPSRSPYAAPRDDSTTANPGPPLLSISLNFPLPSLMKRGWRGR